MKQLPDIFQLPSGAAFAEPPFLAGDRGSA